MPHLLHLDSSADLRHSRTRAVGRTFADTWTSLSSEHTVTHRDLHLNPPPHLPDADLHWPARLRPAGSQPPVAAEALQQELLAELLGADVLLIDAPLYNYSLPSTLKAWIDYIHVPGVTAPLDGDTQPLKGKAAVIVQAKGALYEEGAPNAEWDHAVPALQVILGSALGMEVSVISTSLTLADTVPALAEYAERGAAELAAAHAEAERSARSLGA